LGAVWQGIVGNFFWAILALGAAVTFGWLRKKQSPWLPVALWGLAGLALMLGCIVAVKGIAAIPEKRTKITADNVEKNLKMWLDDFHLSSRTAPNNNGQAAYFVYVVTFANGDNVLVSRTKDFPEYIVINGGYALTPDDQSKLSKLDTTSSTELLLDVQTELTRAKTNFAMPIPFSGIGLESRMPITENLSEAEFIRSLDDMDNVEQLVRVTIQKDLVRFLALIPSPSLPAKK
jgi:hypothetical protein